MALCSKAVRNKDYPLNKCKDMQDPRNSLTTGMLYCCVIDPTLIMKFKLSFLYRYFCGISFSLNCQKSQGDWSFS